MCVFESCYPILLLVVQRFEIAEVGVERFAAHFLGEGLQTDPSHGHPRSRFHRFDDTVRTGALREFQSNCHHIPDRLG